MHTSLHSVFVSKLYFSGISFLHLLHTRHPKTFLYVWSMSTDWHSTHFGLRPFSNNIACNTSQVSISM